MKWQTGNRDLLLLIYSSKTCLRLIRLPLLVPLEQQTLHRCQGFLPEKINIQISDIIPPRSPKATIMLSS